MARETAVYTHGHHESVLRSHRWRTAENSAAYLLPELGAGQELLDVGCGPGTITADLAALVAPGTVTAVDASADVLAAARATVADAGLENVRFAVADVHGLDFPDDSFDVVHAHQVLQHVGDPVQALREMRRVCRPGGVVAVRDADYGGFSWYPQPPGLDEWLDLYRRVARANGGEPDAGRRLLSWAREAGFADIAPSASTWFYASAGERAWWSGLWADRTLAPAYADRVEATGEGTREQLARIARAWRAWGESPDACFVCAHVELRCLV
ncbi:methyltransferase domain-containing protein [Streptomyces montanisoli]|uniref:Methyltransferase domain-containing protein n=1 Tax=Streptomyces montanisoli TaxID=2798581 RepID=A0A940MBT0_9ACTN|nr:methyltransferase domain-containing protein [Streptomyces montanisoli]MBP0458008.1 methyltransferase domain-containing protein [Streptomyces montanisoli]